MALPQKRVLPSMVHPLMASPKKVKNSTIVR